MRKMGLAVMVASVALLTACSSGDGKYEKLMEKADKAIAESDVDKAIGYYEEILAMKKDSFEYGAGRQYIVEGLLSDTQELKGMLGYLEEQFNDAKKVSDQMEFDFENIEEIIVGYNTIVYAYDEIKEYPNTKFYKDIATIRTNYEKQLDESIVEALVTGIEKDIKDLSFAEASIKVDYLFEIQANYEEAIAFEEITAFSEQIESEMARYVLMPVEYTKRNQLLFEDKNIGSLTLLGEGYYDGELSMFYKIEGDLTKARKDLEFDVRAIFSDGSKAEQSSLTYYNFGDYAIGIQSLTDEEKEISRFDYLLNFQQQEVYKSIEFKAVSETEKTPTLLALEANKTFNTEIVLEDKEKTININSIIIDSGDITLQGKITAKEDFTIDDNIYLGIHNQPSFTKNSLYGEYFKGIATDFEISIEAEYTITDVSEYATITILDHHLQIDLKTGQQVKPATSALTTFPLFHHEDSDLTYSSYFDSGKGSFIKDTAGISHVDAMVIYMSSYWGYSDGNVQNLYTYLSKGHSKFTAEVGLKQSTATDGYGSTVLKIVGDGNVLQEITIKPEHKTVPIDIDVSNINQFEIVLEQTEGNDGLQNIILVKPTFHAKK